MIGVARGGAANRPVRHGGRATIALGTALATGLLALACVRGTGPSGASASIVDGDPFLELVVNDPHGRAIRLAEFRGQVRVLDVWATWCAPCRTVIPALNTLHERYRERGLVVLGISVDSSAAEVLEFQREVPIRYPSGMFNPDVEALIGTPSAVPTTYLIDRAGAIRQTYVGVMDVESLEREIRELL